MLCLTRHRNETIMIGDDICIRVVQIEGDKVRLGIQAPPWVRVDRREIRMSQEKQRPQTLPRED